MRLLLGFLALAAAHGAVIRGVVIDHYSGRPLQRALVTLRPVGGRAQSQLATRSARSGQFTFSPLPAGAYLISISRTGYATLHYGQKAWNAPARPLFLGEEDSPFIEMRLHRLGAVSGMILDENDIGFPNVEVFLYKPTRPPVLAGQTKADERGNFRIGGLHRGRYLVRSGAAQLEDGAGILPTFHSEAATVADARLVEVDYDQQASELAVRPGYGRLFRIVGQVATLTLAVPATLTLSSDMGRKTTTTSISGDFSFDALAPGQYELTASSLLREPGGKLVPAGYHAPLLLDKDLDVRVDIKAEPEVDLRIEDEAGKANPSRSIVVQARPKDLAGEGPVQTLRGEHLNLAPGRWEFLAITPPEMYPVSIVDRFARSKRTTMNGEWTELLLPAGGHELINVRVSSRPAKLSGRVSAGAGQPAIGAPVFLERLDNEGQRRLGEPRVAITGMEGEYSFAGLPPGRYRLASTFEFLDPEEEDIAGAGA